MNRAERPTGEHRPDRAGGDPDLPGPPSSDVGEPAGRHRVTSGRGAPPSGLGEPAGDHPRDPDVPADGAPTPSSGVAPAEPAVPPEPGGAPPVRPSRPASAGIVRRTRISGTWVAVIVAFIVLVFILVFVLQNQTGATVRFLGFSGTLPLGVAIMFATIAGALLVALVGTARILQLRRRVRRSDHSPSRVH